MTRRANPVPPSSKKRAQQAAELYESFSGHDAGNCVSVQKTWPDTALVVGEIEGIMYNTTRDGEFERYVHEFKPHARPDLWVSHDGRDFGPTGGKYQFTDAGFEDK